MPEKFDRMVKRIWSSIRGKKNPRTNKPFTDSDAYAMATAQWKKMHGGKPPSRESFDDWTLLEFYVPISESVSDGKDFLIRGVAINETTTRNGIKYIAKELELAAPTFRGKPILLDHKNEVGSIVGRTTENVNFDNVKKSILFEGRIMDKGIREMINDGRITDVSIGARVKDLVENKDDGSVVATGIEGLEISLVAVPGDPGANIASAIQNSFEIKELMGKVVFEGEEDECVEEEELNEIKIDRKKNINHVNKHEIDIIYTT